MVKTHLNEFWPTWGKYPPDIKKELWGKFQDKYSWNVNQTKIVEKIWNAKADKGFKDAVSRVRIAACKALGINPKDRSADFTVLKNYKKHWMLERVWNAFVDNLWTSGDWWKISEQATRNRNSMKEGSITKHTTGARTFAKCRHILSQRLKRKPTHTEAFDDTHTRKNGQFVDLKSETVLDKYKSLMKEKHGALWEKVSFDPEAWKSAVGEKEIHRSYLYGFGSLENPRVLLGESSRAPTTPPNVPSEQVEELQEIMQKELEDRMQKWLSDVLPGMLTSFGYPPVDNASRDNVQVPPSSGATEGPNSSQNDNEKTDNDGDDDAGVELC